MFEKGQLNIDVVPNFTVAELNQAIGNLLERGFAPRFFLHATVSKSQLKKGHLWLTLSDGKASISAVIWSSTLKNVSFRPNEEDGVEILGKLNFWQNRASLVVQVIQIRPTLSTVLRQFQVVRALLLKEGLIDDTKSRPLPKFPRAIAILTSVPSSAYADMLRTAKERWPLTKLVVFPIPVQGDVSDQIQRVLFNLSNSHSLLAIDALVLARGGGSREDLMVFDNELLCRTLSKFPVPVITGLGHEDDLTVADLVADHRAATPTASIVDLLPSREIAKNYCAQLRQRSYDYISWLIQKRYQTLVERKNKFIDNSPLVCLERKRTLIQQKKQILQFLSPSSLLKRGFCIVQNKFNKSITTIKDLKINDQLMIEFSDGFAESKVSFISHNKDH